MKRIIIVHGWGGNPDEPALVWLDQQLTKIGLTVIRPAMPNPEEPNITTWVNQLASTVGTDDSETYFVGHSIGCQTILRYLETLNSPVGGAVFIAGWFTLTPEALEPEEDKLIAEPWLTSPINFEKIKTVLPKSIAIFSQDDPLVPVENEQIYKTQLGAQTFMLNGRGHFSEADGVREIPEALQATLTLLNFDH